MSVAINRGNAASMLHAGKGSRSDHVWPVARIA
jgi:hypothetical protein